MDDYLFDFLPAFQYEKKKHLKFCEKADPVE